MKGLLQSIPLIGSAFVDIRPEEVRGLWRAMQEHFRTTVVNKQNSFEMQAIAQGLQALGITRRDRFLRNFTTTIGRRIYTPFEVGVPQTGWPLWSQVVICAHEHQHVVQHDREGVAFEVSYLADRAARARWEAEAYRSNLELHFWRYGTTPSAHQMASVLSSYGCRPEDIEVAAKSLALSALIVWQGGIVNESSKVALAWLGEHVPHLRARPASLR
ncbi:MAG: hypothetical protein IPI49_19750 [Myxococcales bacterium]|nr:hypothetical protein [Myxococcales bacterium]